MTDVVVDASVAVKWFLDEPLQHEARGLRHSATTLIAPDLLLLEVASAFHKRVRRGELEAGEALGGLATLARGGPLLHETTFLVDRAFTLAERLSHSVYDCLYLALALHEDVAVVTADRRFHDRVEASDYAGTTRLLGDPG